MTGITVPLGELLISDGILDVAERDFALAIQAASGREKKIGAVLVEQGLVDRVCIARALARQAGWKFYNGSYSPDTKALDDLGFKFVRDHGVYPLRMPGRPSFIMADADDTQATDHILARFGESTDIYIGIEEDICNAIALLVPSVLSTSTETPTIIKRIFDHAFCQGATDIHIEPAVDSVNVRLRIDGVLHFYLAVPRKELSRIVNVVFSKAGISAGDFQRFHDARFEEDGGGRKVDVRVSHIPTVYGSSLVMRLLDKSRTAESLYALGYSLFHRQRLEKAVKRPHGLILITGPTGCGKTTSLYALLNEFKGLSVKTVTVEDPVEVLLPLVTQVPVDLRREHDFHHITRALLRHDPDIVLIGEIRDEKTAREAVRAAVTGHRVLATLHTNDVVSAIYRLNDLGIDDAQLSHVLTCVVSQRLVRLLCSRCKEPDPVGHGYCHRPQGCLYCYEGFKGRTVAAEVMLIDDDMRLLIEQRKIQEMFVRYKQQAGCMTMREDAERLVNEGCISTFEVERVFG
ncbi:MAG: Flp pilus assembly complex ATPase component TadA [Candidatus Omnitrophica bacterium]|nr:Flp pilus assembly complex ATPase component TadA [Candidatus Omnitrophota bacterium]